MAAALIIGVGHKARHGKNTFAAHVASRFGSEYSIVVSGFADALKKEASEIGMDVLAERYGVALSTNSDMSDPLCQTKYGKQPKILQAHGQGMRESNPWYWINKVKEYAESLPDRTILILADMRYKNEALWVKETGGATVKVSRDGFVDTSRDPNHISEVDLDCYNFDYTITAGEGCLGELKSDAEKVFRFIIDSKSMEGLEADYVIKAV